MSVSCSKDDTEKTLSEETASLTVTLNGQAPRTKAVAPPEDADELEKAENTVKNATVFVFNANGTLEEARANAYAATEGITFENKYMRHDIGKAIDEA